MTGRFLRFTAVGGLGFLVDVGVLYAVLAATGLGPYVGRALSFVAAATFTWWCNRRFTFETARPESHLAEWARFLAVSLVGGSVNYGTYALLITLFEPLARQPILAVAAGSAAGLAFNFLGSSLFVFRPTGSPIARAGSGS